MHKKSAPRRENTRKAHERNGAGALVLGAVAVFALMDSKASSHALFAAFALFGIAFALSLHMRISAARKRRRFAAWLVARPTASGNVYPILRAVRARNHNAEANRCKKTSERSAGL